MATTRPAAAGFGEENGYNVQDRKMHDNAGNGAKGQPQPVQRRALGDIGNLVGPFNTRCNVGKDNALNKKPVPVPLDQAQRAAQVVKAGGVLTRRTAAAAGVVIDAKGLHNWGAGKGRQPLRVKDQNVPQGPAGTLDELAAPSRRSLSSIIQDRSETAVANRRAPGQEALLPDIDAADKGDPLAATDYVSDIYAYYRRIEPRTRPNANYMASQGDINEKMRAILVDWLVEVHLKFKLMPETLHLSINLIDRFLERKPVSRKNLQLVGVTAMLIASKYEEIWAPELRDFIYISDKAYTREQILAMEKLMLNTLNFNLTVPTAYNFLGRLLKAAGLTEKPIVNFATYLVELALPEYTMVKYPCSMIAAAAVYLASRAFGCENPFPPLLNRHSGLTEEQVKPCAAAMYNILLKAQSNNLQAVLKKYSHAKFLEVAKMDIPPLAVDP